MKKPLWKYTISHSCRNIGERWQACTWAVDGFIVKVHVPIFTGENTAILWFETIKMQAKQHSITKHIRVQVSLSQKRSDLDRAKQGNAVVVFSIMHSLDKPWYTIKLIVITAQFANSITYFCVQLFRWIIITVLKTQETGCYFGSSLSMQVKIKCAGISLW